MLAHRFHFVKNFFQVFSNFFSIRFLSCRSRDSFDIISLHTRFVNTFFKGNYFYFEFLFQGPLVAGFSPVPAVSWPLCPDYRSFIPALRRGALYLWLCCFKNQDAGYDARSFIGCLKILVEWISSPVMGCVMARIYVKWFPFVVLYIHAPVCILMHCWLIWGAIWICCNANF